MPRTSDFMLVDIDLRSEAENLVETKQARNMREATRMIVQGFNKLKAMNKNKKVQTNDWPFKI